MEVPKEWQQLINKADGTQKNVILSANDIAVYVNKGEKELDKLEDTLAYFEKIKDKAVLWWRPQSVMREALNQISLELGDRYQSILDRYKEADWGICDETENTDRAVEQCDAYYGEMNAIIQPFQNAGKPIMLENQEVMNMSAG
jgi:hypothetical protein